METLRNEPVILTGNGGMGSGGHAPCYHGGNDLTSSLLTASLLGGGLFGHRGHGYDHGHSGFRHSDIVIHEGISDIRREVAKSESDVKDAINAHNNANTSEFRSINTQLCDVKHEISKEGCENRIAIKDAVNDLYRKIDCEVGKVSGQVTNLHISMDKQFCETNRNIDKQFCDLNHRLDKDFRDIEERELKAENRKLRYKLDNLKEDRREDKSTQKILRAFENVVCCRTNPCGPQPVPSK